MCDWIGYCPLWGRCPCFSHATNCAGAMDTADHLTLLQLLRLRLSLFRLRWSHQRHGMGLDRLEWSIERLGKGLWKLRWCFGRLIWCFGRLGLVLGRL